VLRVRRAVKPHDEVVPDVVSCAALFAGRDGARHMEDAPVGDAADDAAALEDEGARCAADSRGVSAC
jgi:hypothetical protein